MPFTGGQAAITYTIIFGILLALFIASGAFGKRGWLNSVLKNRRNYLIASKHCDESSDALRYGGLFARMRYMH